MICPENFPKNVYRGIVAFLKTNYHGNEEQKACDIAKFIISELPKIWHHAFDDPQFNTSKSFAHDRPVQIKSVNYNQSPLSEILPEEIFNELHSRAKEFDINSRDGITKFFDRCESLCRYVAGAAFQITLYQNDVERKKIRIKEDADLKEEKRNEFLVEGMAKLESLNVTLTKTYEAMLCKMAEMKAAMNNQK